MKKTLITDVTCYITNPERHNYVVVKVTTDQGVCGYGCATFQQRPRVVQCLIEEYLRPLLIGKDASNIQDIWQMLNVNGYWRNGPVSNNAIAGIDMALWDIKAKQAGLPLYQLLGGRVRNEVNAYAHAEGETIEAVLESVEACIKQGYRYIRCQIGLYGGVGQQYIDDESKLQGQYYSPQKYMQQTVKMFEAVRARFGDEIELIHDVHERLDPKDAIRFVKQLEPFNLCFIEDIVAPEQTDWIKQIRQHTTTPLAIGELFNHPQEYLSLIQKKEIDILRVHVSQVGGITPALKIAAVAELNGVKIVWHGPRDLSPIGVAVNTHLNLCLPNVYLQEFQEINEDTQAVFPGSLQVKQGKMNVSEELGIGVSLNEELALKYPNRYRQHDWTQARSEDGTIHTP